MKEKEYNGIKDIEEHSEGPIASLALVLRMPIARMPELVRMAEEIPGAKVIYQRTSAGRLYIAEDR